MKDYQRDFIEFALEKQVLRFGEFILKSGRTSPYFFNAGLFKTGGDLARLGRFYAAALVDANIEFDLVFGPAYKGIPIATTTAVALFDHHNLDVPYCFNRKEAKTHGEGGSLVGADLNGKIMLVDDVITAGTAIRESMEISAIQEVERDFGTQVISIVTLGNVITFLEEKLVAKQGDEAELATSLARIKQYRQNYGI